MVISARRRRLRWLALILLALGGLIWLALGPILAWIGVTLRWQSADRSFLFKPYVQLGDHPGLADPERAEVVWHAADRDQDWWVEVRPTPGGAWVRLPDAPRFRRVRLAKVEPHRVYTAEVGGLVPGGLFGYRVGIGGRALFESEARARVPAGRLNRVAVVGDIASGSAAASRIAWRIGGYRPDLLVVTGDVVYSRGRISEYADRFFPVYNADVPSASVGAPVLRSTLAAAAAGNHDLVSRDLDSVPDAFAFFLAWSMPLNGPIAAPGLPNAPVLEGSPDRLAAFLDAAGPTFPRMANFSFDSGDAHWTVLDTNPHVDWSDPALRAWVERDLASAPPGRWRLVALHQPGFNSADAHFHEQQARLLSDVFERGGVSIVFAGHVHNYQRTRPLTFAPAPGPDGGRPRQKGDGHVDGAWNLDLAYDGRATTVPKGVIHVITGAGGATLHDSGLQDRPASWLPFTVKVVSNIHSYTQLDVTPDRLTIRQVDADDRVVDEFAITRP